MIFLLIRLSKIRSHRLSVRTVGFIQQRGVRAPWDHQYSMKKIAIIEHIHKDGLEFIEKNKDYDYELIEDVTEENLIKKLPEFDACIRVSKLNENILKHCPN